MIHGIWIYCVSMYAFDEAVDSTGQTFDKNCHATLAYTLIYHVANIKLLFELNRRDQKAYWTFLITTCFYYLFVGLASNNNVALTIGDPELAGVFTHILCLRGILVLLTFPFFVFFFDFCYLTLGNIYLLIKQN